MGINKLVYAVLMFVLLILILFFIQSNRNSSQSLPKFKLGINNWVGFAPFYLAQDKGFFQEEGIDVHITVIEDVAQRKIAMVKGDIDGLGDTVDLLVLSRSQNVPSVAVMEIDISDGADGIVVVNKIESVDDLKNIPIAVQKNFVSESFLDYILYKNGLSPNQIRIIDMEAGAAGAAFLAGKVDAAVTFEPWLSQARRRKDSRILFTTTDVKGVIVDILTVNENYLAENEENVKKVIRAWFKAIEYWSNNKEESNTIMAKHYDISREEFENMLSGLKWPSYKENIDYFNINSEISIYKVADIFNQLFTKSGKIKNPINLETAINSKILLNLYEK